MYVFLNIFLLFFFCHSNSIRCASNIDIFRLLYSQSVSVPKYSYGILFIAFVLLIQLKNVSERKKTLNNISSNAAESALDVPSEPPKKFNATMKANKVISQVNAAFLKNRFVGLPIEDPPAPRAPKIKILPIFIKHI